MMKLTRTLLVLALSLAAIFAMGNVDPDSTRWDNAGEGTYGLTVDLAADADTVVWFGFQAWTSDVYRMNVDIIVTPLLNTGRRIVDGPPWSKLPTANPRAGSSLYVWGPDTLTVTNPSTSYCCDGIKGWRITAIDTTGYVKVYATGGRP